MKLRNSISTMDVGGIVQILDAQFYGRAFAPHWHQEYAVGLIIDGVELFEYRGATHRAISQQVVLFDAGEVHTGEAHDERGFAFRMLYIPGSSFREVTDSQDMQSATLHFPEALCVDDILVRNLAAFHGALDDGVGEMERETRMLDVLACLVDRASVFRALRAAAKPPAALKRVRDLLLDRLFQELTLDDLAREAGISKYHLLRSFRKHFGLPPHAYQLQQRVFRAKRLMESGRLVADIAIECGFVDQSHLNRVFRPYVGVTPGQYAEQFRPRRRMR